MDEEDPTSPLLESSQSLSRFSSYHTIRLLDDGWIEGESKETWSKWNFMTARIAEFATVPFLIMQVPQIVLNTQNLISGNTSALHAVGWTAQLSSLMGNLSLLSYFVNKKETGASAVQTVGVLTTLVVLLQLAMAKAMPWAAFVATVATCTIGFMFSFFIFVNFISVGLKKLWIEIMGIGGMYVLVQVVWSTFVPHLPPSILPGVIAALILLVLFELARWDMLSSNLLKSGDSITGWIATLLFMWSPVSQLYTNITHPEYLYGLSVITILLALAGNSCLMPRALFTRDLMWFSGCTWGAFVWGWGILLSMYSFHATTAYCFWGISAVFALWLGLITCMDMKSYHLKNPFVPYLELIKGTRKI